MRPLELRLRNFRSYFADGARFDFRDRRLVGIVGPIGSGKSTILDAISFALYGKTPAIAAATKSLIHQRADEGAVSLRFEVEGEEWEAVRMLRRKGASQHALYRYGDPGDEEPAEKLSLEAEVNERIARLLGLEFDAFRRSVFLPQGRFAEFLRSRPADRDKVLKGLFGHDRIDTMRELAKERAGSSAIEVARHDARLERFEQVATELEALGVEHEAAQARLKDFGVAEPEARLLNDRSRWAARVVEEAEARVAQLVERTALLPARERVEILVADSVAARSRRKQIASMLDAAGSELARADGALAAEWKCELPALIEEGSALVATLAPLQAQVEEAEARRDRARRRLEASRATKNEVAAAVSSTKMALDDALERANAADRALAGARAALHDAEHTDIVAALRSGIAVGEACPVCAQLVVDVPMARAVLDLEEAREVHEQAEAGRTRAEAERATAGEQHAAALKAEEVAIATIAGLVEEVTASGSDADKAVAMLAATVGQLKERIGPGDPEAVLNAHRERLTSLRAAVTEARTSVDRVRADHDQAICREQDAERAVSSIRIELADAAARAGLAEFGSPSSDGLLEADAALREGIAGATEDARRASWQAGRDLEEARRELVELLSRLGIEDDLPAALARQKAQRDLLRAECDKRRSEVEQGSAVHKKRETVERRRATYERIATDLTDARFVRYLLDEERARLAALGGEHFLRLSSGRYLFADDGQFSIVDQVAADAVRKADSLSGGETFLASLALALSLAEMVSRTGGRLDSFFLDEGFGSLDSEHLDLAMEGIEALVAGESGRLVVVVSHGLEMRERVEDLIQLDRDANTGDTQILAGASLRAAAASPSGGH